MLEAEHRSFFPLIVKDAPEGFYGILESVTIHISKATDNDKIIIVPSEKEIEKKILDQCKRSWNVALDLSRHYIKKPYAHHEVIISFDKRDGFYEGNSLGIVLTLSFLMQLLKFYNPTYIIKIKELTAFTGGISDTGQILPTGEEIIKRKVNTVFFSEISTFVIPKCEETNAQDRLDKLKENYSNRNLKIVPIDNISDVLNRRDLVDIRKQKLIMRTTKFVKKNWVSALAVIFLTILLSLYLTMDLDDNPTSFDTEGLLLFIKNKNGKVLWTKKLDEYITKELGTQLLDNYIKILDINNDKSNEVLLCKQMLDVKEYNEEYGDEVGSVLCLNKRSKLIWKFEFKDTVFSERVKLPPIYYIELIDTISKNENKQLLLFANNGGQEFSSAIFKLDLITGERIEGVHWCSGFTYESTVRDVNKDGIQDLILLGTDGGYENSVLWIISSDKVYGYRPTTEDYRIQKQPESNLIVYVRFPRTDYDDMVKWRGSAIIQGSLM